MTVREFVSKKDVDLNSVIKTDYVPYVDKLNIANKIAKHSTHAILDEKMSFFKINTPLKIMLTNLEIVNMYTNIKVDFKNATKDYDDLLKSKLISDIFDKIPESEIKMFVSLVDMCVDDIITNERDIIGFLENKLDSLKVISSAFDEIVSDMNIDTEK